MALISRLFMLLTIVAAGAAIAAGFLKIKPEKEKLTADLSASVSKATGLEGDLAKQKKTSEELAKDLDTNKKKLTDVTSEGEKLKNELKNANEKSRDTQQKLDSVSAEASGLKTEIEKYSSKLPPGMTIDQVASKLKEDQDLLTTLEQEKKVLNEQMIKLDAAKKKAEEISNNRREGKVPPGLTGHILAINDDWNFVVIDLGTNNAVVEGATAVVYRDGNLVAKIKISSVEPSIAIGDILPDWKRAPLQEGDLVTF